MSSSSIISSPEDSVKENKD